jgi:surface protein
MANIFSNCASLTAVPSLDTANVTDMAQMFSGCSSLTAVPLLDTANVTNMQSMFSSCYSLTAVPLLDTANVTNMTQMFSNCWALPTVPLFDTSSVTTMSSIFLNCYSLVSIPAMDVSAAISGGSVIANMSINGGGNISWCDLQNIKTTISFSNQKLSGAAIENIFDNLAPNILSQTITMSGNYGLSRERVIKSNVVGYTNGSRTATLSDTSGLEVGMYILTNVPQYSVTFNYSGNTVTFSNHSFSAGTPVTFSGSTFSSPITSGTPGIFAWRTYYIVNPTTNTFQLAETLGGSPVTFSTTLVAGQSGVMRVKTYITAIVPNTSIELSWPYPSSSAPFGSLTAYNVDFWLALSKNWAVTT